MISALIVDGPSCSGKSTLLNSIDRVTAVSHTTRSKRPGEIDGVDYYFVTVDEFRELEKHDEFIEVNYIHDNLYGLTKSELQRKIASGKLVLLDVESNGLSSIIESQLLARDRTFVVFIDCMERVQAQDDRTRWLC